MLAHERPCAGDFCVALLDSELQGVFGIGDGRGPVVVAVEAVEFFGGPEGGQMLEEGGVFDHADDAGADGA